MKLFMFIFRWFDFTNDFVQGVIFFISGVLIYGIIPEMSFLVKYNLNIDYAIWGAVGQTAFHFAKFRFPELAGGHRHVDSKIGTKIVNYIIDCTLSALVSLLSTDLLAVKALNISDPTYIAVCSVSIGACYETILKAAIKKTNGIIKKKNV